MSQEANKRSDIQAANEKAQAVKRDHEVELMGRANVVGVGVGLRQRGGVLTDEVALVVMVRQKMSRAQLAHADVIPTEIEGVPVDVQEVGDIVAH